MNRPAGTVVRGPLAPFAEGFYAVLIEEGYSPSPSAEAHVRLLAQVSRWLEEEGLGLGDLTAEAVERFLRARREQGYARMLSLRGMAPLLGYLGGAGVLPSGEDAARRPVERLLDDYRGFLVGERGLAEGSVRLYVAVAGRFLSERSEPIADDLARLSAGEVIGFVRRAGERGVASGKTAVCVLRSLLGYLYVEGWTSVPLAPAVPAVAGRRGDVLPRALEAGQVALLLASCEKGTAVGVRDFAILTVLSRLGLRAQEVASLQLGDLDWRAGEVVVRGKGPRLERLPLPPDVGEAIAGYLRRGRPRRSLCPQLFLRTCAPLVGLSRAGVTSVVGRACRRAGMAPVGAHRLRHTVAVTLLRRGASLTEVGQLLRHESLGATSTYARVDRAALAALALPWPGAEA